MTGDRPPTPTPAPLHPLLAGRWSPLRFDPGHVVSPGEVRSLIEAARWSPSAGNSQPWSFIVGRRGDETFERLVRRLAPSSRRWAPDAGVLLANLAHRYVEGTDWEYSEFAAYDLGQAVAHLTLQARALGLQTRQFRAFDQHGVAADFGVPAHWEVVSMAAVGRSADESPEPDVDRRRRAVDEVVWTPLAGPAAPDGR
jgi:nitroreductase